MTNQKIFDDLVQFAQLEVASGDLEPWAEIIRVLPLDEEERLYLVKLYNCYDSLSSAWQVYRRWPLPGTWAEAPDRADAAKYPIMQERRNLFGGRVLKHLASYTEHLVAVGGTQADWLAQPKQEFLSMMAHVRQVWGVGRLSAYEWTEFLHKTSGYQLAAPDAQLKEASGPRKALQELFENPTASLEELNGYAIQVQQMLKEHGVNLDFFDLETILCDNRVGHLGRYYPGRHLAALRGEVDEIPDPADRALLLDAFMQVIPEPWNRVPPKINKSLLPVYKNTGKLVRLDEMLAKPRRTPIVARPVRSPI